MARVQWSESAFHCIREQIRYIAEESGSSEIAWKWAEAVLASAEKLKDFPNLGHHLPECPTTPYLEIIVRKHFRLIYRYTNDVCYIITVRRCSMLLNESTLDDLDSL